MASTKLQVKLYGKDVSNSKTNEDSILHDTPYQLSQTIEISSSRSSFDNEIIAKLEKDDILEFEFEDGTVWLSPTEEIPTLFKTANRSSDVMTIIPNGLEIETQDRNIFKKVYLKFVKIFKPSDALVDMAIDKAAEFAAEASALLIAKKIESSILPHEGLNYISPKFEFTPFDKNKLSKDFNPNKPVVLFLHGTSSSTEGSFGELVGSEMWTNLCKTYGQNILGLEHRTWSKNPFENAWDALEALPPKTQLHLISHSRGGLVGEVLARVSNPKDKFTEAELKSLSKVKRSKDVVILKKLNTIAAKKKIKVTKFVRVACPAAGTTILTKRIDHFLNILLNLIGYGLGQKANPLFIGIKSLLTAIVEQRTDPNVLPGLEVMIPNTPLQKILNNHQVPIISDLAVIAGNAGTGSLKKTLMTIMSRLFYQLDNDFVVDTDSMYMGAVRTNKIYYKFVAGGDVDHFSYFKNKESQQSIFQALTTPSLEPISNFKEVRRGDQNRNVILDFIPGGSVMPSTPSGNRPILILIPGIMGSNLYDSEDEIWLHFRRMAMGSMTDLHMGNENVQAKSLVGSSYKKFVKAFSDDYDVCVYPYDWRKPLTDSGAILNEKIKKEWLPLGQPVQIVAHSMGGLVVRDLMMNHQATWNLLNKKPDFRCVLLGTPWQGSYGIPEIITGLGKNIKLISRIAIFQSRQELLEVIVRYSGLLQLLPTFEGSHNFEDLELWKTFQLVTDDSLWALPHQDDLNDFAAYKKKVQAFDKWNLDKVYYVAGKEEQTVSNFVYRDQNGAVVNELTTAAIKEGLRPQGLFTFKKYDLAFQATTHGDGSVTWEHGIPPQMSKDQVYYMETTHGELANDPDHFDAIQEILSKGSTNHLSQHPPVSRAIQKVVFTKNSDILSNDLDDIANGILGLKTTSHQEIAQKIKLPPLQVSVKNGDLRYAKHPILVGHFKNDGIVSAEKQIDAILEKTLSERNALGLYPGGIGTNYVHLPDSIHSLGVVVVGLGSVEDLTPFRLSQTIEMGCLEYLLSSAQNHTQEEDTPIGISTLLVGSQYANQSLGNSINAILEGIYNANKKLYTLDPKLKLISEVEFVELYKIKADHAFYHLNQIATNERTDYIDLKSKVNRVEGARSFVPLQVEKEWWRRITATVIETQEGKAKHLNFSASTGRARVEKRESFASLKIIDNLLEDNKKESNWDRELTKSIFELIVPNDFKLSFRNQQNLLLILDKSTAAIPWELLNYDDLIEKPIVTTAGMIRQLATSHDRRITNPITIKSALIIGDPILDPKSGIPRLPEAAEEGRIVNKLLQNQGFATTALINKPYKKIFRKLYGEYKIIHVASHGVIDYGEDKKTGILLSDNVVLTAAEINQISNTPELVFINSCHMGEVDPEKEKHFRNKYKLAANLGVQFIENGVKAVVVAGWEVNDAAANLFAKVFYENMLAGEMFADAVKEARFKVYNNFKYTNTWGAYQCYGDQYYQLVPKKKKAKNDYSYILEAEILVALEEFISDKKSPLYRDDNFLEKLKSISEGIDNSGLRNAEISELEIQAYRELEAYDFIIEKYEKLLKSEKAGFTVKSIEMWCNSNMKYLFENHDKLKDQYLKDQVELTIKRMNNLIDFGGTAERYSLLGSIYKRYFLIGKTDKKLLIEGANQYKKAYSIRKSTYTYCNWLILELTLNEPKRIAAAEKILEKPIKEFVKDEFEKISISKKGRQNFWNLIAPVNIKQIELLLYLEDANDAKKESSRKTKSRNKVVKEIKDLYKNAWDLGGGTDFNKKSEITQIQTMIASLKALEQNKRGDKKRDLQGTFKGLQQIIDFFEEL